MPEGQKWGTAIALAMIPLFAILLIFFPWHIVQGGSDPAQNSGSEVVIRQDIDSLRRGRDQIDGSPEKWSAFLSVYNVLKGISGSDPASLKVVNEIYGKAKKRHESLSTTYVLRSQKSLLVAFQKEMKSSVLEQDSIDRAVMDLKKSVTKPELQQELLLAVRAGRNSQKELKAKAVAAETAELKERMNKFEGDGAILVAVGEAKVSKTLFDYYFTGTGRYLRLWVSVLNDGLDSVHANPTNFTISTQDGSTSSVASITYRYDDAFDAVDLSPGQRTSGWIVFETYADTRYTLTHRALFGGKVEKIIIP